MLFSSRTEFKARQNSKTYDMKFRIIHTFNCICRVQNPEAWLQEKEVIWGAKLEFRIPTKRILNGTMWTMQHMESLNY